MTKEVFALKAGAGVVRTDAAGVVDVKSVDLTFWESVVWSGVAFDAGSLNGVGAVCGSGMMRFSPGCRIASCDRSFTARMLLMGTANVCAMPLNVSPACTV